MHLGLFPSCVHCKVVHACGERVGGVLPRLVILTRAREANSLLSYLNEPARKVCVLGSLWLSVAVTLNERRAKVATRVPLQGTGMLDCL